MGDEKLLAVGGDKCVEKFVCEGDQRKGAVAGER